MNHLDGIKILDIIERQVGTGEFNWMACIIAFFTFLIILTLVPRLVAFGRRAFEWKGTPIELIVGGIILGCSVLMGYAFGNAFQPTVPQTTYKICIVDETIGVIEFNNTYEVLNKEGEIYTVIFKDNK